MDEYVIALQTITLDQDAAEALRKLSKQWGWESTMTNEEINKAVAEKVRGWSYDPIGGIGQTCKEPAWILDDNSWILVETWNPSERIDHAWMVVEKYNEFDIRKRFVKGVPKFGCAIFGKLGREFRGEADTAPLAICLAALEAVKEVNG